MKRASYLTLIIVVMLLSGLAYLILPKGNKVEAPGESKESFSKTGNLVKNNPGMEPGEWYLVYETPGAPGNSIKLKISASTRCDLGGQAADCSIVLRQGGRVSVIGEIDNNLVEVNTVSLEVNK